MRPEVLAKIKELVGQGAVVLGPKPNRSPSLANFPEADKKVKNMANELWGSIDGVTTKVNRYGKGMILQGMTMEEAFDLIKTPPDFKITNGDPALFIHRSINEGEVYFISNQKNAPVKIEATFRVTGLSPQLWNAIDGSIRDLPNFTDNGKTIAVPLELAPNESVFIVFTKDGVKPDTAKPNYPVAQKSIEIKTPWTVTFDSNMRGPAHPVVFNTLTDWSKNQDDSIRYYSGTAWYRNSFNISTLSKGEHYIVDLGEVTAIAKVVVNGVEMGGAWTPPYQVDITKALKPGVNKLEIKVVNTWVNRLVGDSKLPEDQRKTSVKHGPDPNNGLQASGLLGAVVIKEISY